MAKWLRQWIANPSFPGSSPGAASTSSAIEGAFRMQRVKGLGLATAKGVGLRGGRCEALARERNRYLSSDGHVCQPPYFLLPRVNLRAVSAANAPFAHPRRE